MNLKRTHYFVATGYRGCIQKWNGIEKGRALNDAEVDLVVALILDWIGRQLDQKWVDLSENYRINVDQQGKIDQFIKTGKGLSFINVQQQIDCLEYKNILSILKWLDPNKRLNLVVLDLSDSK